MYHTALKGGKVYEGEGATWVKTHKGIIVRHDVTSTEIPTFFQNADVMYSEPAWPSGLKVFNKRAGREISADDYYDGLNRIIARIQSPAVLVCGKSVANKLKGYSQVIDTKLNGDKCVAYLWNIKIPKEYRSHEMLILKYLAEHYETILDPCCGYGRAGEEFTRRGKKFIMSDYDAGCIGYLKHKYENI